MSVILYIYSNTVISILCDPNLPLLLEREAVLRPGGEDHDRHPEDQQALQSDLLAKVQLGVRQDQDLPAGRRKCKKSRLRVKKSLLRINEADQESKSTKNLQKKLLPNQNKNSKLLPNQNKSYFNKLARI